MFMLIFHEDVKRGESQVSTKTLQGEYSKVEKFVITEIFVNTD